MTLWQRTDGSLFGAEARSRRDEILDYFQYHGIPAALEIFPATDELVEFAVLADPDGRAATVRDGALASGLELEDLAADIAERFDLNVVLGDVSVEMFDEEVEFQRLGPGEVDRPEGVAALRRRVAGGSAGDDPVDGGAGPDGERGEGVAPDAAVTEAAETDGEPAEGEAAGEGAGDVVDDAPAIRAITITSADEQYFPVLARTLGEPVTTASAGGREVVLTSHGETAPGTFGWDEGALPIVQLIAGEDRSVYAVSDEAATARTWGTERTIVTGVGAGESFPALESALAPLDSDDDDARVIASVSPTADLEAVKAALRAPAETGPALLLDALGIGAGFADFLDGAVSAEEMPGARLWEPATAGQVFRGVLEDAFDEAADLKMVELASDFDARWPALSRSISVVKAAAGGALIVAAARSTKAWRSAGALTGGVLLLDSLADVVLYEWLRRRRER